MNDLTITHAHRVALRRVQADGDVGDLRHLVHPLVCAGLVEVRNRVTGPGWTPDNDGAAVLVLSDDGRKVLEAHDAALDKTRPMPRPVPELPDGWRQEGDALHHRDVESPVVVALLRCDSDVALTRAIRQTDAMSALMRWEQGRRVLARVAELRESQAVSP